MKKEDKEIQYRPELADKLEECMNTAIKLYQANIKGVYYYYMSFTMEKGVHDELLLKASECFKPNVPFGEEQYYEYYQKEIASKYGPEIAEITQASAARLVFSIYKDLIKYSFDKINIDNLSKMEKYMVEHFENVVLSPTRNLNIQIKEGNTKCYYDSTTARMFELEKDLKAGIEYIKKECQNILDIFRTPNIEKNLEDKKERQFKKKEQEIER